MQIAFSEPNGVEKYILREESAGEYRADQTNYWWIGSKTWYEHGDIQTNAQNIKMNVEYLMNMHDGDI